MKIHRKSRIDFQRFWRRRGGFERRKKWDLREEKSIERRRENKEGD